MGSILESAQWHNPSIALLVLVIIISTVDVIVDN